MRKGIFLTIEGPDGAGKSTQLKYIKDFFEKRGITPIFTREPGGTDISEKIRELILDKDNKLMNPKAETLLYAAARAQLVNEVIKPALEEGKIVICDRYIDSSIAYQGFGRGLSTGVEKVNKWATDGLMPHMTILLYVDPDTGRKRRSSRAEDRIEIESDDFHRKVFEGYMEIAKSNPERVLAIDGREDIEIVRYKIEKKLITLLEKM